jgi:RHS repeat-associated protein
VVQDDPQGNPPSVDNLFSADPYANRFLYTGREFLKEANLYDYRNRVYSAELGRFLQTDPIRFDAGDVNLYRYVGNSCVDWIDPDGLAAIMRCFRCIGGSGQMQCYIEEDGEFGPGFTANAWGNAKSITRGDPYGTNGPLPPGEYDIVPRTDADSKSKYPNGTPSVSNMGQSGGHVTTPLGTQRSDIMIHGPGRSEGCVTCKEHNEIKKIMNRNKKKGGMKLIIEEICC